MNRYINMRQSNRALGQGVRAEDGTLWLYDVIASDDEDAEWFGGVSPMQFIGALAGMSGPVTLRINSPGGSVFGAQAMVAAMRAYAAPITARIDSLAASAASVIASEAADVEMAPGAMMMIHKAWGLAIGNADDLMAAAALFEKIDGQIAASYARRAKSNTDFLALMAAETWFTAEEAVAAGLADRVITENNQRPAARWDLGAYLRAPSLPEPEAPVAPVIDLRAMRSRRLAARLAASPI